MPASPENPAAAPHVILLEEYGALAVAISSALRKFVPDAKLTVAKSFDEAADAAATSRPELVVVDFDPPPVGAVGFFDQMQRDFPDGRALVLAAGTSREIAALRRSTGAIQFIEKPFGIEEFGAAVQALLGPWQNGRAARGRLSNLGLADVLPLVCLSGATAVVTVQAERRGEVYVQRGRIINAQAGRLRGTDAIEEMLTWRDARLTEKHTDFAEEPAITGAWSAVLFDALRRADERIPRAAVVTPPSKIEAPVPPPKTGKKIVVIDDTEMLLLFVEDVLQLHDAQLQITTASTGLQGVKEAQRLQPDLILLDYSLPDITGDEVCRGLLADERTRRVPIVMMSGHVPQMTAIAAEYPNVVATIAKPFLSEALLRIVDHALDRGALTDAMLLAQRPVVTRKPPVKAAEPLAAPVPPPPRLPRIEKPTVAPPPEPPKPKPAAAVAVPPPAPKPAPPPAPPKIAPPPPVLPPARPILPASPPRNAEGALETRVLLSLPLQITGMDFTPAFQVANVRARPAASGVALQLIGGQAAALPVRKRFHIGAVTLDAAGHLATVRLDSSVAAATPAPAIPPASLSGDAGHFASGLSQSMTMQLIIPLDLAAIQLSPFFEISELVLKCHGSAVRGTLDGHSTQTGAQGATFRVANLRLDAAQRISELTLAPAQP